MSEVDGAACADAYRALRGRVREVVAGADPRALDAPAPATPEWRVRDVLAHVVGVNADILAGNLAGVGTDPWTAVQVDARRDRSVEEILDEWDEISPTVEGLAPQFGPAVGQWLFDACTHEHDLRHALGAPGARDTDAVALSFDWVTARVTDVFRATDAPAVVFRTEAGATEIPGRAPQSTVQASRFEILRAITGRRSRAQIERYEWEGPARPEAFNALGIFTLRADDFVE